ncbi:cyclin-D3-1-like [Carica papaya]|uniref:cyclin-D3-1-like n=1 Tax=Carica papaya TaxID=3649 RepID=UPI000B8CA90E|nr:cyclin-D3-1-like [Carica papaya]
MADHQYQSQEEQHLVLDSTVLFDALYCSEENWEEELTEDYSCEEKYQEQEDTRWSSLVSTNKLNPLPVLLKQDLSWDDEELSSLLSKQEENHLCKVIETDPSLSVARRKAVEWMLKVISHYSFSAVTAVLAVNYLDRFLFSFHYQREKPWMIQLASVACLSLAAKVEETQVPLLLDLQVGDCAYVFEAKQIQRMEILVLSTLQWKMNPVIPLSFLDYMTRRLGLKDHLCWEFLSRCERIILSVISDSRFMMYLPSVMATATMLHVINGVAPSLGLEYQDQLLGILGIKKDKVDDCCKLIIELASRVGGAQSNKRKFGSIPGSPNGVMDMSFSSDSSNDSWAFAASSVSSSPEPVSKKTKTQDELQKSRINDATADNFLSIPH